MINDAIANAKIQPKNQFQPHANCMIQSVKMASNILIDRFFAETSH